MTESYINAKKIVSKINTKEVLDNYEILFRITV